MKKIKQFNKPSLKTLTDAAMADMKKVAEKYGLDVKKGGGTFDADNFTMKIEFSIIGENGEVITKEAKAFKECAHWWELQPEDLGKEFTSNGKTYVITGAKPRSPKFPILVSEVGKIGGHYKFPASRVVAALGRNPA